MSAERMDLAELRQISANGHEQRWVATTIEIKHLDALLAVAEAALELRAATNSSMRNTGRQTLKERSAKVARFLAAERAYSAALAPFKETTND